MGIRRSTYLLVIISPKVRQNFTSVYHSPEPFPICIHDINLSKLGGVETVY